MHNTSQLYQQIIQYPYQTENAIQIGGTGVISHMTDAELRQSGPVFFSDYLRSMKTSAGVFSGAEPSVGNCMARKIMLTIRTPERDIMKRARLVPFCRVVYKDMKSEWIPKGVFYIDTRQRASGKEADCLMINGYDAIMKTEQLYENSILPNPAQDISIVQEIANKIGVAVDPRTSVQMSRGIMVPHSPDYTYREVLGYIAAMYGGNFTTNDFGQLQFVPLFGGA